MASSKQNSNCHLFCNTFSNVQRFTGATSGAGTAYPPEHLSSSPVFSGVRVTQSLILCACFVDRCLHFWHIVLSVFRYMDSDYPFGIFKLFLPLGCPTLKYFVDTHCF
jgi:hypothetical protein